MSSLGNSTGGREATHSSTLYHHTNNDDTQPEIDPEPPPIHNPYSRPQGEPPPTSSEPNHHFGDDIYFKTKGVYRHIGGNVNGISSKDKFADVTALSIHAITCKADGASFIETNINYERDGIAHKIRNKLKPAWHNNVTMIHSNADIKTTNYYQPGGVCQVIGGRWTRRTTCSTADPSGLGQWTYQTLSGPNNKQLTIITAYQVCQGGDNSGEHTAWRQRQSVLTRNDPENDNKSPNPRHHFAADLTNLCRKLISQGQAILVFIDANSNFEDGSSWLHEFLNRTGMHDVYNHHHGYEYEPATYTRGTKRIDFMFTTTELLPYIDACGYTPFQSFSDHRIMYCDLHLVRFFQDDAAPSQDDDTTRYIYSKYKKMRTEYKKEVLTRLTHQQYEETINNLTEAAMQHGTLSPEQYSQLDEVDRLITATMVSTEKQMRRHHSHPWSPTLIRHIKACQYWKSWIKELRTTIDQSGQRAEILLLFEDTSQFPLERPTLAQAQREYRRSNAKLKLMFRNAEKLREQWLLDQEDVARDAGEKAKANILRNIRKAEATARSYQQLRQIVHGRTAGKLKCVLIPKEDGSFERVSKPKELIETLIARNIAHFNQAEGTAFTGRHIQHICANTFSAALQQLHELTGHGDEAFDAILDELLDLSTTQECNGLISGAELMGKFKYWREATSTSPSGCHLGLYRSILKGDSPQIGTPSLLQEEPNHGDIFFDCLAKIINICVRTGHILPRWKSVTNVMLEKIPGQPLLPKLRVINIFEADFNAWAGLIFSRRLIYHAERLHALGNEQGGSRQGRTCIDVYAMKFLSFQISETTRTPLAVMDNDAKACYDRIVMALAYLRSQQLGMDHSACRLLENFLSQAQYHIQTQHGISNQSYSSTADTKLHGPGQGSQCSPAIWTLVSTLILQAVRRKSPGTVFTDPRQQLTVAHYMQSFVDDSSIWVNDFLHSLEEDIDLSSLTATLETVTQWWEQLLVTTGGKLELPKCFFYINHWQFSTTGAAQLASNTDHNLRVTIRQSTDGQTVDIRRLESNDSHRTLGFQTKPSNDFEDQYRILLDKSVKLTRQLRTHRLDPTTASRAYHSIFLPRISYALNLCGISEAKLAKVQSPALTAILQFLGYPRSFPRTIVLANKQQGGLGFSSLYTEQGILNITFIMRHLRQNSQLGDMIRIQLRWFQQFAGVSYLLLEKPSQPLLYLPSTWFNELRAFLSKVNGKILLPGECKPSVYRQCDEFIMDKAASLGFTNSELDHLNRIRLFLKVERISDITNVTGDILHIPLKRNPLPTDLSSITTTLWPRQLNPGKPSWRIWKYFLSLITTDGKRLRTPLGPWLPRQYEREWSAVYDIEADVVLCRTASGWTIHTYQTGRRGVTLSNAINTTIALPANYIPVQSPTPPGRIYHIPHHVPPAPQTKPAPTWPTYLTTLPAWESDLISNTTELVENNRLLHTLHHREQTLYIVSDGGCDKHRGSFGWVIADESRILWEGWGIAHGNPMSSYRAEGYGRLAAIRFLLHYATYLDITPPDDIRIETATDNKALLPQEAQWRAVSIPNPYRQLKPDIDILLLLNDSWHQLNRNTNHAHVKGHQDDHQQQHLLPWKAQLNIRADQLATYALDTYPVKPECHPTDNLPHLYLNGKWITSKFPRELRRAATRNVNKANLAKIGLSEPLNRSVNWEAFNTARNRLQPSHQAFALKALYDWNPTNSKRHRENPAISSKCPHCEWDSEDLDHVLQCTALQHWRVTFMEKLNTAFDKASTPPAFQEALCSDISHWLHRRHYSDSRPCPEIPVRLILRGIVPKQWETIINSHYEDNELLDHRTTGRTWTTNLIQLILQQTQLAWKIRTTLQNEKTATAAERATRVQAQHTVQQLYALIPQCTLRYPFVKPLEERLQQSTEAIQTWIDNNRDNIHRSHTRWKLRNRLRQTDIRHFLQRRVRRNRRRR